MHDNERIVFLEQSLEDARRELAESVRGEIELKISCSRLSNEAGFLRDWICQLLMERGDYNSLEDASEYVLHEQKEYGIKHGRK